jgi:O-antigen/teichoic acid export membrane protein
VRGSSKHTLDFHSIVNNRFASMADTVINTSLEGAPVGSAVACPPLVREQKATWSGVRLWSARGLLALLDQGLISGANFLVGILLARHLAAKQYGAYALAFEIFLFLSVAYGALVLEPLSVFGASVYRNSNREYLGILLRIHAVIAAVIFLGLGVCALVLQWIKPGSNMVSALVGVGVASPCILLFWLARRGFYVRLSPREAALGAFFYSVVVLGGLIIVDRLGFLSPLAAFLLMAAGAVVTAPMMLARLGLTLRLKSSASQIAEVIRRHWGYGRWALGSAVAIWFSGAIYYPLLGAFHGLGEAGSFKALMNFSSPIGQAFAAMSLLSLPFAARAHHHGSLNGRNHLAARLAIIYGGGTILYWVIIVIFRGPIIHHLYAGHYAEITSLVPWLALGSVLRISATSQAVILRAMHSPYLVFVAYAAASAVAVLLGVPCTWAFGLSGSVFTLVLSSAVALVVASVLAHRHSSNSQQFTNPSAPVSNS